MAERRRRGQPPKPRYNSMVASAAVMATRPSGMAKLTGPSGGLAEWMEQAWAFYDVVGELRFGVGWLGNGMSRVNLVAARQPETQGDEPSVIEVPDPEADPEVSSPIEPPTACEQAALDLVAAIAGGVEAQGQLLAECCTQLTVPGVGWILVEATDTEVPIGADVIPVEGLPVVEESWAWSVRAYDEIRVQGDFYEVQTGANSWRALSDSHVLIKVWRGHARKHWEPDSPCRAALPILRQITMLDEHVIASASSRLAGAGLLIMPTEAEFVPIMPMTAAAAPPVGPPTATSTLQDGTDGEEFMETMIQTASIAIGDRGSAAAVVPLGVRLPGDLCDKPRWLSFWTEFSDNVLPLREAGVKRLALSLDMPPEVLTGMADVNHWTAWQVAEAAVTLHIEPMAETCVHALTIGYLRPALEAMGFAPAEVDSVLVWYDTTDLTTRPDRSADAISLYDRIELSGSALRRESGLSEDDKPSDDERRLRILLDVAKGAPTLAPQMLAEAGILDAEVADAAAASVAPPVGTPPPPPPGEDNQAPPEDNGGAAADEGNSIAASAVVEACDALVMRALERAGVRLRSAAGRGQAGGASSVSCDDPVLLHTQLDATRFATPAALLDGAWGRVPRVSARLGIDPLLLRDTLNSYCTALIATGHAHDTDRLAAALGVPAAV